MQPTGPMLQPRLSRILSELVSIDIVIVVACYMHVRMHKSVYLVGLTLGFSNSNAAH